MEPRIYTVKHELILVALAWIFLTAFCVHSNNLSAASTVTNYEDQETSISRFDRSLLKARELQNRCDYKGALAELKETSALANELKNIAGMISVRVQMSDVYLNVGKIDRAKLFGQEALEMASGLERSESPLPGNPDNNEC